MSQRRDTHHTVGTGAGHLLFSVGWTERKPQRAVPNAQDLFPSHSNRECLKSTPWGVFSPWQRIKSKFTVLTLKLRNKTSCSSCRPGGSSSSADMECGGGELSDSGSSGYWSWDHGNVSPAASPSVTEMDGSPDEALHMELEHREELSAKKPKVHNSSWSLKTLYWWAATIKNPFNDHCLCLSVCWYLFSFSHRALSEVCISVCGPVVAKCSLHQWE